MLEILSRAAFNRDVQPLDDRTATRLGWTVVSREYPVLDVVLNHGEHALRLRLDCAGWDDEPPSIQLLTKEGTALATPPMGNGIFHPNPHPLTGELFICMRGSREFHTHFSHINEPWFNYRGQAGNDLLGLVHQICRAWRRGLS